MALHYLFRILSFVYSGVVIGVEKVLINFKLGLITT